MLKCIALLLIGSVSVLKYLFAIVTFFSVQGKTTVQYIFHKLHCPHIRNYSFHSLFCFLFSSMAICISLSSFSTRFTFLIVCRALRASSMRPFSTSHLGLSGRPMNPKNCITLGTPAIPSIYLEKLRSESLTIYQQKTVGTFRYTFAPCSDTYVTLCVCAFMQAIIWKRFLFAALK